MNLISSILNGFAWGIIFCYIIINTFFSENHALDSADVKNNIIIIDNKKFKLVPYII